MLHLRSVRSEHIPLVDDGQFFSGWRYLGRCTTRDLKKPGQVQRLVIAERFDMSWIAEYDAYARKTAHAMLAKHDAWLKRREIDGPVRGKGRVGYVGLGIFGSKHDNRPKLP